LQSALKGKENSTKLHKEFHSTPDLKGLTANRKASKSESLASSADAKSKSLSQENLNKLRSNPRHSWACISSTVQALFDRNYEGSWKSIEKLPDPPPEADKPAPEEEEEGGGHESDGSTASHSSSSGEDTPKSSVVKTPVLPHTQAEYRTIKPLRPVQSKTLPRRASTGCTISPAEQQTIINLVPPGQVIKVDVSKSSSSKEYGTVEMCGGTGTLRRSGDGSSPSSGVMSSFKPTDSAKLYASPDDLKSIGYRDQSQGGGAGGENNGTETLKKSRSRSLPPDAPGSKKDGIKSGGAGDYAEPVNKGVLHNGSVELKKATFHHRTLQPRTRVTLIVVLVLTGS
jgi:SH3/ankyrin repeat-containing protein